MRIEEVIGARIRAERERQGLTLEAVGQQLQTYLAKPWTPQAVWQAERGQRDFRAAQLVAIALVLGMPVARLLAPTDDQAVEIDSYTLTDDDVRDLFPVAAIPQATAELVDIWARLDDSSNTLRSHYSQIEQAMHGVGNESFAVLAQAHRVLAFVDKASASPRVRTRIELAEAARAANDATAESDS